ncbi:MAG: thioesterase family protein [Candidatus Velthaea sp.]
MTIGPTVVERVRWHDVDRMNIVYYGAYLRFTEGAEAEFFRAHGFTYDVLAAEHGIWLARIHLDARYRAPARLDDEIATRYELTKLGGSALHFTIPIERATDGARLVDVRLVLAALDATTLKATRIPRALRTALQAS